MITALCLIGLSSWSFSGGKPDEFVNHVHRTTGQAVFLQAWEKVPAINIPAETIRQTDGMRPRHIRKFSELLLPDEKHYSFPASTWGFPARNPGFRDPVNVPMPKISPLENLQLKGGQVTLKDGKPVTLLVKSLRKIEFAKRLTIPEFLDNAPITFQFQSLTEEDFLRRFFLAAGGRFTPSETSYRIDLNPSVMREQWARMFEKHYTQYSEFSEPILNQKAAIRGQFSAHMIRILIPDQNLVNLFLKKDQFYITWIDLKGPMRRELTEVVNASIAERDYWRSTGNFSTAIEQAKLDLPFRIVFGVEGMPRLNAQTDKKNHFVNL